VGLCGGVPPSPGADHFHAIKCSSSLKQAGHVQSDSRGCAHTRAHGCIAASRQWQGQRLSCAQQGMGDGEEMGAKTRQIALFPVGVVFWSMLT